LVIVPVVAHASLGDIVRQMPKIPLALDARREMGTGSVQGVLEGGLGVELADPPPPFARVAVVLADTGCACSDVVACCLGCASFPGWTRPPVDEDAADGDDGGCVTDEEDALDVREEDLALALDAAE